jgi:hypothetical protein
LFQPTAKKLRRRNQVSRISAHRQIPTNLIIRRRISAGRFFCVRSLFKMRPEASQKMNRRRPMMSYSDEFPWQLFWLLEVVFLAAPTLITVIVFQRSEPVLTPHRVAVLIAVLIGLTAFNVILSRRRKRTL